MTKNRRQKAAARARQHADGVPYSVARRQDPRRDDVMDREPSPAMPDATMFSAGATVIVDEHRVLLSAPRGHNSDTAEFRIHRKGMVENAWARWVDGGPRFGRADAVITALSCVYCAARTDLRCCEIAFCQSHRDHHQAVEHAAPAAGRYQAVLNCPSEVLDRRYGPSLPRPAGVRYPRDLSLMSETRPGDALRVIDHVRRATVLPGGPDPIGDALGELAGSGDRLPTRARIRWVVADILARCTWPALAEAAGDGDTARWMQRQPHVTSIKPTPLSERLYALDAGMFGLRRLRERTLPGQTAAADALCDLWPIVPDVGRGALGFSGGVGSEVLSWVLARPDGAERAGNAIARAQEDAIATTLTALAEHHHR